MLQPATVLLAPTTFIPFFLALYIHCVKSHHQTRNRVRKGPLDQKVCAEASYTIKRRLHIRRKFLPLPKNHLNSIKSYKKSWWCAAAAAAARPGLISRRAFLGHVFSFSRVSKRDMSYICPSGVSRHVIAGLTDRW